MSESVELSFDGAEGTIAAALPSEVAKTYKSLTEATSNQYLAHKDIDDDEESSCRKDSNADDCGKPVPLPPPDIEGGSGEEEKEKPEDSPRSVIATGIQYLKYLLSMVLTIFCLVVVMVAIFEEKTVATRYEIPPVAVFFIFWISIILLATIEGGQGCLVGLQPVDKALYAVSHPLTLKVAKLAHWGDNMERFIVGRQFLAVLCIFVANSMATITDSVLGLQGVPKTIFIDSGIALMLITIVIGQLTAQLNAANCMLDFVNNYFMLFCTHLSLGVELSGLLHAAYFIQIIFSKLTGKPIESNEPPRNVVQNLFFWGRVLISLLILGFCLGVTLKALFNDNSGMWRGLSPVVTVVIFFLLLGVVGMMEGMQIALFAVVNLPDEELSLHRMAYKNCHLIFTGQNFQAFLVGRQIFVACCIFIVARIASINIPDGEPNIFGLPKSFEMFVDTGLHGSVVLTIIGSLAWRIVASSFPLAFLSNPLIYILSRICLLLDLSGICSASWVFARCHKRLAGLQPDEVYLGIDK